MKSGQKILIALGVSATAVGNPGRLMDAVKKIPGLHLEVTEGIDIDPDAGVRPGMLVTSAIGADAEVVAKENSPLVKALGLGSFKVVETLSHRDAPRKPTQGPGFKR
jgi:hypothetical protein